ncbi:hypothetical protein OROGR_023511 [Orobanche gracilis]
MSNIQEDVYICLSFSSYSSDRLAEIAGRVAVERSNDASRNEGDDGDDDFEFASARECKEVSLDEFSHGGQNQIWQVFPVFNRDLLLDNGREYAACGGSKVLDSSVAIPLGELFIEEDQERDDYPPSCSSSSEADELDDVPAAAYCVWRPKMAPAPAPGQCKKSKSTGFASKQWSLRDFLRRCKSDGKDSFVFINTKQKEEKSGKSGEAPSKGEKGLLSASVGGAPGYPSAHEAFYIRNKAMKEGDKKKSYLPYRQGLVGFLSNVNGLSRRSFPHF